MLRGIILAGAGVIALTAAANAADLNRAPAAASFKDVPSYGVNWSGVYIGVNGGYGADVGKIASKMGALGPSPDGGFGGGQIGLNLQRGNIVFGVEADLQAADITDSGSLTLSNPYKNQQWLLGTKSTLDWFGTLRGRLGYAADSALIYATGGLAYGHITDENSCKAIGDCFCAPGQNWKRETDATGYVVGGGAEYKFNPSWSAKAEYQYLNLGQENHWAKVTKEDFEVSTVRLGLNYHVGHGYEPLR